jgi:DivIVA domain-containing protein
MDFSPQTVRSAGFKTVKRGYDPAEVENFKEKVAAAIETAQNQATAMEARARAAVAKLQEVSQQVASGPRDSQASFSASNEDAETISRTLLLAQRTADSTISQADADAESITVKARNDATTVIDNARATADKLLDEARLEARRSADSERVKAENEVQELLARRDFLLSDVDHLEHHLGAQRERLRDAAVSLQDLVERVPGGLGEMRRPLLSASATTAETYEASTHSGPQNVDDAPATADFASAIDDTPAGAAMGDSGAAYEAGIMRPDLESMDPDPANPSTWSAPDDDPMTGGDDIQ